MRNTGGVPRLRSAEECIAMMRLDLTAVIVMGICLTISGVVLAMAWRVLSG
jgi:hypothetical protein